MYTRYNSNHSDIQHNRTRIYGIKNSVVAISVLAERWLKTQPETHSTVQGVPHQLNFCTNFKIPCFFDKDSRFQAKIPK